MFTLCEESYEFKNYGIAWHAMPWHGIKLLAFYGYKNLGLYTLFVL